MKDAENQLEAFASDKDAEGVNPPPAAESAAKQNHPHRVPRSRGSPAGTFAASVLQPRRPST